MTQTRQIKIPEYRISQLDAVMDELARKARKLSVAPPTYVVDATWIAVIHTESGEDREIPYVTITVTYERVVW